MLVLLSGMVSRARADLPVLFFDDFDDGNYSGWTVTDIRGAADVRAPDVVASPEGYSVRGTGSGYQPDWSCYLARPISLPNAREISIEVRARSGPAWPNAASACLFDGQDSYQGMVYGESNRKADFLVYVGPGEYVYRHDIGDRAYDWHTYAWTRDSEGWWSLSIDGVVEAADFRQNLEITSLDHVELVLHRDQSEIEWVRISGVAEPTEGWIAFGSSEDGDEDIWAVRPDGSGLRQLVDLPGGQSEPQWSPDSRKIVYASPVDAQLWVYDWFTGTNTKIYEAPGSYRVNSPAWSPDGSRILFQEAVTYNNPRIAVINSDGTGRATLVGSGFVTEPSWAPSPDGTVFTYTKRNSGASYSSDLWIYDNGTNKRLTAGAGSESTVKYSPDWTPSGDIAFTWGHNITILDPGESPDWRDPPVSDRSSPYVTARVTNDASYPSITYGYPSWSPDLSQIVYLDEHRYIGLGIVDAVENGTPYPLLLTHGAYGIGAPDWGNPSSQPPKPLSLFVDTVNGDDDNDGLTRQTAFATIQKGIDSAQDGYKVVVYPGVYAEEIIFIGKAITVQGVAGLGGVPVLENPGDFAASFYYGEGRDTVLKNFVIRDSFMAVFIAGSSPTISNMTIVENKYGIEAYAGSEPDISSSIFWNNIESDLFQCQALYSCTYEPGDGNIDADPCFVDPNNGDYHLRSKRGRYWPEHDVWVLDKVTSPCIDAGDPYDDPSAEPMPNGDLVNMGAYGGTPYASMSEWSIRGDINHDGIVNMIDFLIFADYWLQPSLRAREIDNRLVCAANLRALGKVLLIYANDHDDQLPTADQWCDLLLQRESDHVTEEMFVCRSAEPGPSHYAINSNASDSSVPPDMVLLFETTAGWNQFGGPELLAPEKHQGRGCNILFVDGRVEFVKTGRFDELRWE